MSIELPVDIGQNALKYSTTDRLQETFVAVIEYLMESEHSPNEWIEFLSMESYQTLTSLCQATERLLELEIEEIDQNNDDKQTDDEVNDFSNASPLSLLCQILVMFGSLNPIKFCPIIMEHAFDNILSSIKYHRQLSSEKHIRLS